MVERTFVEKTGEELSRLGFGCMRLPTQADGTIDRGYVAELFARAIDAGINYFDTAYFYHKGESEVAVGEVLSRFDHALWTLTDKLPLSILEEREDAPRKFEEQRKRTGADCYDHYLLHNINADTWEKVRRFGLLDYIQELKAKGLVRHIGFSFHGDYELFDEAIHAAPWDLCQIQYNYMDENIQAGTRGYHLAEELGIPVVVMEPIRGGALARLSPDLEKLLREVNPERSMASWALRWVADHSNVKVILSGMNEMSQLEDNLATFTDRKPLSEEEYAAIATVVRIMKERRANGCTGCRYCTPCEQGVDIPGVFSIWNRYHEYQNYGVVKNFWEAFMKPEEKPTNCISCGVCETKCPQGISIRDDLALAQKELDEKIFA